MPKGNKTLGLKPTWLRLIRTSRVRTFMCIIPNSCLHLPLSLKQSRQGQPVQNCCDHIIGKQHSCLKYERVLTIYDYHQGRPTQRWFAKRSFENFTSGTTLNWLLTPEYKYLLLSPDSNCMNYITTSISHNTCLGKCFRPHIYSCLIHQIKQNQPKLNLFR